MKLLQEKLLSHSPGSLKIQWHSTGQESLLTILVNRYKLHGLYIKEFTFARRGSILQQNRDFRFVEDYCSTF